MGGVRTRFCQLFLHLRCSLVLGSILDILTTSHSKTKKELRLKVQVDALLRQRFVAEACDKLCNTSASEVAPSGR